MRLTEMRPRAKHPPTGRPRYVADGRYAGDIEELSRPDHYSSASRPLRYSGPGTPLASDLEARAAPELDRRR